MDVADCGTLPSKHRQQLTPFTLTINAQFYFAAIGAAVGFGNVWRFPALAADYGGGAFFVPYLMALFLIGIPLLILEISLGQYYQTGDVGVFGSFHRRWRGVGVSSVACAYMVVGSDSYPATRDLLYSRS